MPRTLLLFLSLTLALTGCRSTGSDAGEARPKPPPPPTLSPADRDEIAGLVFKLNNPNRRETPRSLLLEIGSKRTPLHKQRLVETLTDEYRGSRAGTSATLNADGRARALFIIARLAEAPERTGTEDPAPPAIPEVLREGLSDPADAPRLIAAEALAARGDATVLPVLLAASAALDLTRGAPYTKTLTRYAVPQNRAAFVAAMTSVNEGWFGALVELCFGDQERGVAFTALLSETDNAAVLGWAIDGLTQERARATLPRMRSLVEARGTRSQVGSPGEDRLRSAVVAAHEALVESYEERAAARAFFLKELQRDPEDAGVFVTALKSLGGRADIEALSRVVEASERALATRLAALEALASLSKRGATATKETLVRAALPALRASLSAPEQALARRAVVAVGELGDPVSDTGRLVELSEDPVSRQVFGPELVTALGALGGAAALGHLVAILELYPKLRERSRVELSRQPLEALPLFALIDQLDHADGAVRSAAFGVLRVVAKQDFGYNPSGAKPARDAARRRWLEFAQSRSKG